MADQDSKQAVVSAFLASGFPFQTAIAELVQQVPNCKLLQEKFPWRDDTGSGFLDLVVNKHNFIMAIECKKTQKEILTFLQPGGSLHKLVPHDVFTLPRFMTKPCDWSFIAAIGEIKPNLLESMFCVVSTSDSGKDQRMLEKDAQILIRGEMHSGEK